MGGKHPKYHSGILLFPVRFLQLSPLCFVYAAPVWEGINIGFDLESFSLNELLIDAIVGVVGFWMTAFGMLDLDSLGQRVVFMYDPPTTARIPDGWVDYNQVNSQNKAKCLSDGEHCMLSLNKTDTDSGRLNLGIQLDCVEEEGVFVTMDHEIELQAGNDTIVTNQFKTEPADFYVLQEWVPEMWCVTGILPAS